MAVNKSRQQNFAAVVQQLDLLFCLLFDQEPGQLLIRTNTLDQAALTNPQQAVFNPLIRCITVLQRVTGEEQQRASKYLDHAYEPR